MERRRQQKLDIHRQEAPRRRSQQKRPTFGCWQPAVPIWERDFCKAVGSLDWEMFLRKKKFIHLYYNVINWDDSAGEEAFQIAKQRFWSEKHGVPCEIPFPDPDLYIDEINWDSQDDPELPSDLDIDYVIPNSDENHEPVVVFGDSFIMNQAFSPAGWGDYEENMKTTTNMISANHANPWEHNWGNAFPNATPVGWTGFCDNGWSFLDGSWPPEYVPWAGGWSNTWGWNYSHYNHNYGVDPGNVINGRVNRLQGVWNTSNVALGNAGGYRWNEGVSQKVDYMGETSNGKKMPAFGGWDSGGSFTQQAAIAVGRMWN